MADYVLREVSDKPLNSTYSKILDRLLKTRDINSETEADKFLSPSYDEQLHSYKELHDIDKALVRINQAIDNHERIAVFSDYDCDGIPGAVILYDLFQSIKFDNFENYIPHRHYEGFGLSIEAIDKLKKNQVKLIITIDCGTTNVAEIEYAKKIGIDVIVTDHHEPGEVLPPATAIVNPKLGDYPFSDLCGAAVAFKLAEGVIDTRSHELVAGWQKWWLDMVGIATIADMVPLKGENRVFALYGLKVLRKSRRPGLQALLKKSRVDQRLLTEEDIGFTIGPRINAASRMDTPEDAFFMLAEKDLAEAGRRVDHLEKLNKDRKTQVGLMTKEIHSRLKNMEAVPSVLVMGSPDWRPSLVGLAASKLAEEYNRPAFLWGTDGNGVYKGSCRSGGDVSVVKLMEAANHIFIEHGGHHFSGGFSVKEDKIFDFPNLLVEAYEKLGHSLTVKDDLLVDAEIYLSDVNQLLINELNKLAPFGTGNHKPIFIIKNVTPQKVEVFGKTREHTKLVFNTESKSLEAICFFKTPEKFTLTPKDNLTCNVVCHVEESAFMGRRQIRLRLLDVLSVN